MRFAAAVLVVAVSGCTVECHGGCGGCVSFGDGEVRRATASWPAAVTVAEGIALPAGTTCLVTADLESGGSAILAVDARIVCGTETIYRGRIDGSDDGSRCGANEAPTENGQGFSYTLECTDRGDGERARLALDTPKGRAVVDGIGATRFHVELAVAGPRSTPQTGGSLYQGHQRKDPGFTTPLEVRATVTNTIGFAGLAPGAACTVRVRPYRGNFNCHVSVRCPDHELYGGGGSGFTDCTLDGGVPVHAIDPRGVDEEGDPKLDMSLRGRGTVIVSNDDPGATYRVELRVDQTGELAPLPAEQP